MSLQFFEILHLSFEASRDLPKLEGFPAYWWMEDGQLRLWPEPDDGIRVLYDDKGEPAGFVVKK
jgi:hypothetical protein